MPNLTKIHFNCQKLHFLAVIALTFQLHLNEIMTLLKNQENNYIRLVHHNKVVFNSKRAIVMHHHTGHFQIQTLMYHQCHTWLYHRMLKLLRSHHHPKISVAQVKSQVNPDYYLHHIYLKILLCQMFHC